MKKILFGLLAAIIIMANSTHPSAGAHAIEQARKEKELLVITPDELKNPEKLLKKIQENPEYVNAQVIWDKKRKENLMNALITEYLWVHIHNPGHNYDPLIRFVISQTAPQELVKYARRLTLVWVIKNRPLSEVSDCIDLLIEKGIKPQTMLDILEEDSYHKDDHEKVVLAINTLEAKLETLIAKKEWEAASKEVIPRTFPQINNLFELSNPHLLAIKHAIEEEDLNALAKALKDNKWLELKDATGYTPLLYAAYLGKREAMRFLIEQGANINAQTKNGAGVEDIGNKVEQRYAELIAEARLAREKKLAALKKAQEEQEKRRQETLQEHTAVIFAAINANNLDDIQDYTTQETINRKNDQGRTPLIEASILGKAEIIPILLGKDPNMALTDNQSNTALHRAIAEGHYDIANLIIKKMDKESLQKRNQDGFTAYDLAMRRVEPDKGKAEQLELLVETMKAMMQ